jgi:hypothetical protein
VSEEGPTTDSYTIVLRTKPTAAVTVTIDPDDQTDLGAGPGAAVARTFTTTNWDEPQAVAVTAVDDGVVEGAHTSTVTHAASSSDSNYDGIAIGSIVANVADNDSPGATVMQSAGSTSVSERGPTSDAYTIVLDAKPVADVIVVVTPDVETDLGGGPAAPIQFTFTPSDWHVLRTVVVTAVDDDDIEGPHASVIAHAVSSDDAGYDAVEIADIVAQVTDDDEAGVRVIETGGGTAVSEGVAAADSYQLVLDSRPTATVSVTIAPDAQTDVGGGGGVAIALRFISANWNQPQTVAVMAVDDDVAEGPHASAIRHTAASGDPHYAAIAIATLVADVGDNDTAGVTIDESGGVTAVSENGPTSDTYAVSLGSRPSAGVQVTVDPDAQTDIGAGPGEPVVLVFTDGGWDQPQTVEVTAVVDAVPEGLHTSTITHRAMSSDVDYDGVMIPPVVATVEDLTAGTEGGDGGGGGDDVGDRNEDDTQSDGTETAGGSQGEESEPPPSADDRVVDRDALEVAVGWFFGAPLCGFGFPMGYVLSIVGCGALSRRRFVRHSGCPRPNPPRAHSDQDAPGSTRGSNRR